MPHSPKITVIFPLYQAASKIDGLLQSLFAQRHPQYPEVTRMGEWTQVIFIDNASTDSTVEVLRSAMEKHLPLEAERSRLRIVRNEQNIGLSRSLNKAFGLVETPFAMTCHCDCRFGRPDYVARMLELLETHPGTGAITGRPTIESGKPIPFTEKVNLITNLMDLFPASETMGTEGKNPLITVGFSEGRCDGYRMDALRAAGFYDTTLKLAGEDQLLAAKMREKGFEVHQAPELTYYLSLSAQQDTLSKLAVHQRRFGRVHPYILIASRGTHHGTVTEKAGANRRARTFLRLWQLFSAGLYLFVIAAIVLGLHPLYWLGALALAFLGKTALFRRHLATIPLTMREFAILYSFQPVLDVSYSLGFIQGLWFLVKKPASGQIG